MQPPTTPKLSVVVPTRDGRELLAWSLPPLIADLATVGDAEVIVVDDHSGDGSASWLQASHPQVRLVSLEGSEGFAAACNAGARGARAPIIAFLNNDAEVLPGWSRALLGTLAAFPEAVIAGALAMFRDSPANVNSAGVRINSAGAAADIGFGVRADRLDIRPREVAGVSGVSMAVRASWFQATGGFDEHLVMYFEDVELCLRAWLEGHTVRLDPQAVVLHQGSASAGGRYRPLRNYYGSRNRLLVAAGCLDTAAAIRAIPLLLAQDCATVLWLALTGRAGMALSTGAQRLAGVLDGLRQFPAARRATRQRPARPLTFKDLRDIGIVDSSRGSLREFARMRRREITWREAIRA